MRPRSDRCRPGSTCTCPRSGRVPAAVPNRSSTASAPHTLSSGTRAASLLQSSLLLGWSTSILRSMPEQPELWLRGPIAGVDPLLMPAAHALLQTYADVEQAVAG